MQGIEYLYELHEKMLRCGPGDYELTRRAFSLVPRSVEKPRILDIGCGNGIQTLELAKYSNGDIVAIDNHQAFLDFLNIRAREQGFDDRISARNMSMLEMDFSDKSFDLIWSEGALYFMGFENGLKKCHQLLSYGGYLVVSELVYFTANPPLKAKEHLSSEYPGIKDIKSNADLIQACDFNLIDNFTLPKKAWLNNYYVPLEARLDLLTDKYKGNQIALDVFKKCRIEIDFYKEYYQSFGYEFFVMEKRG